jgi:hypothetical protein
VTIETLFGAKHTPREPEPKPAVAQGGQGAQENA